MSSFDQAGFEKRTTGYLRRAAAASRAWYDDAGNWIATSVPSCTRERYWLAFALYRFGDAAFTDAVVRSCDTPEYHGIKFNIFDTNIAVALLVHFRDRMTPATRSVLERLTRDGFSFKPGNRQPDYQYHGYNDNMPSKATMGLILGGELLGEKDAVEYGLWNLRQMRALLVRHGTNSEYNSPTYSPLTVHAMGEIAEHAKNEEARELARGIEARLWLDIAARFHPEIGVVSGPYSRAYTADAVAHLSILASMLWFVVGDIARPSPMLLFEKDSGLAMHHMGDAPFNIVQMCWLAAGSYHISNGAMELFHRKRYPYRAIATSEMGDIASDQPARGTRFESVLEKDFAVGTSDTHFLGGGHSYAVTYKRREPVASFKDVGTVFNRMVLDDEVPGEWQRIEAPSDASKGEAKRYYSNEGESDYVSTNSNAILVQSGATVMSLAHPRVALGKGGDSERPGMPTASSRPFSRLSDLVIFSSHFGGADELIVAGEARRRWGGDVPAGQWIACRRGKLLIAVRPLAYSQHFGRAKVTLEKLDRYEMIRMEIYRGEKREFTAGELKVMFGGFVAEHASADAWPSLQAFADAAARGRFSDYYWLTRRTRYRREPGAFGGGDKGVDIETSWSPGAVAPRYATVNGLPVEWPNVSYDGVERSAIPFVNEPFKPVPAFFPWKELSVEWGNWSSAIGDREL